MNKNDFYETHHDDYFDNNLDKANVVLTSNINNMKHDNNILDKFINIFENKQIKLLDAGCGPGARTTNYIINKNCNIEPFLLDITEKTTNELKKTYKNVFNCSLEEKMPFEDNTFDSIICSYVIQHMEKDKIDFLMNEFIRVLKKGGSCLIIFKYGYKKLTIYDKFYDMYREFNLYTHYDLIKSFEQDKVKIFNLYETELYFSDLRPVVNSILTFSKL